MWTKIAGIILRNRIAFIAGVLLGTIFMGFQARKIQMSYESADLLPKTDSAYLDYTRFRETFGQEGNVMVFAIQDSGFYQLNKTNDWIQMGNDIKALQGVNALMSITHTFNLQKNTDLKKFEVLPIFPSHIETQAELDSLAYVAEHLPFYDGMLINRDKHTYNMMITVSAEVMNSPARVKLVQDVLEITKRFTEKYHLKMHYSGMPYIRVINAENIKGEMYMFIALSLLITAIILYLFFRSFRIVGFCVGIIGINVIWAIGFMAMMGIKITLLTAMLPPLLIVIGIPNCVYMVNKYHAEYVRHGNKIKALQRMIQKVGNASLLSNLTTAAGFATFIITSSQILVDFGLIAFISISTVFFICLILIPSVFSYLPVPDTKQTKHLYNPFINKVIDKRSAAIQEKYDEAKKMQEEAQAEKEKYAACQDEIEVEKNKVLDAARASAREEGRQLIENAQKEADKVIRKAGEDARREKDKMLEQAKHEILSLVLDAAAGSMNKKSDDSALYDEFLKKAGTTENEET